MLYSRFSYYVRKIYIFDKNFLHFISYRWRCCYSSGIVICLFKKYLQKEGIFIILITKQESLELQKLGHRFGSDGSLHHTYSRKRKKYYLTESRKAIADLDRVRKSHIIEK